MLEIKKIDGLYFVYRGSIRVTIGTPHYMIAEREKRYQESHKYSIFPYSDGTYHPKWQWQGGDWYHFCSSTNQYVVCKTLTEARRYMARECIEEYTVQNEVVEVSQ